MADHASIPSHRVFSRYKGSSRCRGSVTDSPTDKESEAGADVAGGDGGGVDDSINVVVR